MLRMAMRKKFNLVFIVAAMIMCFCISISAFAVDDNTIAIEEAVDEVAELEEAAAKASAAAAAEAAKVNDVVDLDAQESDIVSKENSASVTNEENNGSSGASRGPTLAFAVALVLIFFGCLTIAASNKKLKANRMSKTGK